MSVVTVKCRRLETRHQAAELRHDIERALIESRRAIINARLVENISPEAADECWGVLAKRHGVEYVSERVLLPDLPTDQIFTIAKAMQDRATEE